MTPRTTLVHDSQPSRPPSGRRVRHRPSDITAPPGDGAAFLELHRAPDYKGFLLIILPPGGFIVLPFLFAGKRLIDRALAARSRAAAAEAAPALEQ